MTACVLGTHPPTNRAAATSRRSNLFARFSSSFPKLRVVSTQVWRSGWGIEKVSPEDIRYDTERARTIRSSNSSDPGRRGGQMITSSSRTSNVWGISDIVAGAWKAGWGGRAINSVISILGRLSLALPGFVSGVHRSRNDMLGDVEVGLKVTKFSSRFFKP